MTDSSIRFVPELFFQRAIAAPEIYPTFEEQEFSPYLKEHVFDKLSENGTFNLEQLDLTSFEMKHVLPANMPKAAKRYTPTGWKVSTPRSKKSPQRQNVYARFSEVAYV